MKAYEKPKIEGNRRELCNIIYRAALEVNRTKDEIELILFPGVKPGSKDRQIRDLVSDIKKYAPVVSPSDGKGFKILRRRTPENIAAARHQIAEYYSRIADFKASIDPLEEFVEGR
ncbi:MAG: hypothetical protein WC966_10710 [Bradymonadales bacterium]